MRLRAAGSDDSGSNYDRQSLISFSSSVQGSTVANGTSWQLFFNDATDGATATLTIFKPNVAERTKFNSIGGSSTENSLQAGDHDLSSAYDGFTLLLSTGTVSGTVTVYGYQK
jgi:hypothetical protein